MTPLKRLTLILQGRSPENDNKWEEIPTSEEIMLLASFIQAVEMHAVGVDAFCASMVSHDLASFGMTYGYFKRGVAMLPPQGCTGEAGDVGCAIIDPELTYLALLKLFRLPCDLRTRVRTFDFPMFPDLLNKEIALRNFITDYGTLAKTGSCVRASRADGAARPTRARRFSNPFASVSGAMHWVTRTVGKLRASRRVSAFTGFERENNHCRQSAVGKHSPHAFELTALMQFDGMDVTFIGLFLQHATSALELEPICLINDLLVDGAASGYARILHAGRFIRQLCDHARREETEGHPFNVLTDLFRWLHEVFAVALLPGSGWTPPPPETPKKVIKPKTKRAKKAAGPAHAKDFYKMPAVECPDPVYACRLAEARSKIKSRASLGVAADFANEEFFSSRYDLGSVFWRHVQLRDVLWSIGAASASPDCDKLYAQLLGEVWGLLDLSRAAEQVQDSDERHRRPPVGTARVSAPMEHLARMEWPQPASTRNFVIDGVTKAMKRINVIVHSGVSMTENVVVMGGYFLVERARFRICEHLFCKAIEEEAAALLDLLRPLTEVLLGHTIKSQPELHRKTAVMPRGSSGDLYSAMLLGSVKNRSSKSSQTPFSGRVLKRLPSTMSYVADRSSD